jgi:hypothetical protein
MPVSAGGATADTVDRDDAQPAAAHRRCGVIRSTDDGTDALIFAIP